MSSIPILWPEDIKVEVVPPIAILRVQIEPIRRMSGGLLEARLTSSAADGFVRHNLDLIAPALNNRSQRLLSVTHQEDMVYPVKVEAHFTTPIWEVHPKRSRIVGGDPFAGLDPEKVARALGTTPGIAWQPNAETEDEFVSLVGNILRSGAVRGLIQSLIVRSREELTDAEEAKPQRDDTGS